MRAFTKEQNDSLKAQVTEIMDNISEGKSVRDVMAQIYVDNLDEKTLQQGGIIADAILQSVKEFDADYQEAQEDLDRFIRKFQKKADEGKTCAERCNYWLKLSAAVSAAAAAMGDEGADREQILSEIEGLSVSEEEATPEREKALREMAAEAIRNSGVMLGGLVEQAEALENMADAEEAAGMLIDLGNQEIEYRAIATMLAYTKIKNGEFENMPADMTTAQVAAIVCAEAEQARIMEAVGKGSLAVDIASAMLTVLGIVVLARFAIEIAVMGMAVAATIFESVLIIPACLMVVIGVFHLFGASANAWTEESKTIVRNIVKGIKAVAGFVTGNVIPGIVKTAVSILEKVKDLVSGEKSEDIVAEPVGIQA